MNKSTMSYFTGSLWFTVVCLGIAAWLGYSTGGVDGMMSMLFVATLLACLEVSVSVDNAVVNATVLNVMTPFWRKIFLTVGMAIAVFGMRILFPIMIVDFASGVGFVDAFTIATTQPEEYAKIMHDSHVAVMGFGGTFLLTVAIAYFIDNDKGEHWLPIEKHLAKLDETRSLPYGIMVGILALTTYFVDPAQQFTFILACAAGFGTHILIDIMKHFVGGGDIVSVAARNGFVGFMYLEVLDASFSFDGVVAALAITNHFWTIAIGLGIGAMFVRSMTIYLVEKGTLTEFRHLEPAAFWAISFLVLSMMLAAAHIELGELVVGGGSLAIIGAGLWHSIRANKADAAKA